MTVLVFGGALEEVVFTSICGLLLAPGKIHPVIGFTAILSIIREDDEVILFAPAYDSYAPAVELTGGKAIFYNLESPDYKVEWQKVKRLINQRTTRNVDKISRRLHRIQGSAVDDASGGRRMGQAQHGKVRFG